MKILSKLAILFIFLGLIIAYSFIYVDYNSGCFIAFIPTFEPSNTNTKEVLKLIKNASPENYKLICEHVKYIDKNPSCGGFHGGCFYANSPNKIYLGNDQGNLVLSAAIAVHETCHVMQKLENRSIQETECYTKGAEFLEKTVVQ